MEHYPVLLEEVEQFLLTDPNGVYVDCTLGAAGYAARIAERLEGGRLIALDRDEAAIEAAKPRLAGFGDKVSLRRMSFSEIERALEPGERAAGIAVDLGWSRTQIEDAGRGFSFQLDGPLDMRYDNRQDLTAAQILNFFDEREIADLLYQLADERRSRRIARAIVRGRPIRSTRHLAEIVGRSVPRTKGQKIHPATRTFQALRMAVNSELEELDALLEAGPPLLRSGGRMVVVAFHSVEDRQVKQAFRRWAEQGEYEILTRRVVRPSEREIDENPASRSARLRALERKREWAQRN